MSRIVKLTKSGNNQEIQIENLDKQSGVVA